MGHFVLTCNPSIDVTVRRSARARRLSLRVSRLDGRVTLTLPNNVSERDGRRFVEGKSAWIEKARQDAVAPVSVGVGSILPIRGRPTELVAAKVKAPRLDDRSLLVPEVATARAVRRWLIEAARGDARVLSDRYSQALGRDVTKLTFRDTRSRWGSCSSAGAIMLSWRLVLTPPDVFEYVVAHEVAHLKEMNHSAAFWATVDRLMPDYKEPRLWLRREGTTLHRYRFD